ncbi:nitrous oxide reductase family maturation protein NosD [Streptomyces sp. KL2]|uniref:right-handed parallel beta-helix repeat-containing protein n=1 Tax=Streptomyces sp. KL2 TaxID=3050126 RepID=UPI00397A45A9
MMKRQFTRLGWAAVAAASGLAATPPAAAQDTHQVRPGESIQQAVDAARPGDTVVLAPGTFRESVRITTSGLTLRGSGPDTVLMPPAGRAKDADNDCARQGHGICVSGTEEQPVTDATVSSLSLRGFEQNGLWASHTDRLSVRHVTAEKNGKWGIAQQRSTRSDISYNTARGNGDAGLLLSNTVEREKGAADSGGTVVRENHLLDNRIGVTVRRLRNLVVRNNEMAGNCAAMFVVGDETKPRAGALTVFRNDVHSNNKHCPATPRLPFLQGSGIVLTGAEDTLVAENLVEDNVGSSPLSGGIVLFKSFVGARNENNLIEDNIVRDNGAADLADRGAGTGNVFRDNMCQDYRPEELC